MNAVRNCLFCSNLVSYKFFTNCGSKIPINEEEWVIANYFQKGYPYQVIINCLLLHRGIKMSLRTLKTRLKVLGLKHVNVV